MQLDEWREKKYYKTNATQLLFNCPDQVERRNADQLTVEEFVEQY
jgi:hypothetical protein